ncbi:protein-arginine deiminase domain-containing protein [Streptomyces yaanensis]|uniref:Protein-arginine deiminase domain-containing protein n=1 Tax=Streptomyces yaanensis TaxID=1142239 RepID=A0ABV7S8M9_9ACTN|nr:protein-arginine deiminase domain-containing protein [Streptomyces sp. CGMCC 4.7035]WNC02697.1 protein-arginine deiminase domain-containing protein [Streptomyces sp. CGMCC 4.7035]
MRKTVAVRTVLAITLAGVTLAPVAPAFAAKPIVRADLRADVNRDGRVDVTRGSMDRAGEDSWTTGRGAVFLPNIDDDTKRCKSTGADGKPLSDAMLAKCNDAADTKVNGTADAADLARLRTVPMPGLGGSATGTVKVVGTGAKYTRLFVKRATGWAVVTPTTRLSAAELRAGVELGMEGTDVIRDRAVWDGTAVVELNVSPGGGAMTTTDRVTLHAAPLLTQHHLQQAQQVLVTELRGSNPDEIAQRKFVKDLETQVKQAGITAPLVKFTSKADDIWAQDFLEPGYVSMAGPGGKPQSMRVMIRSAQPNRTAGRQVFEKLRGRDVGAVQVEQSRRAWDSGLDSMGNLETIPPYENGGRSYPAGRIIMGERKDSGEKPAKEMRTLLASQGMQNPLLLDTSWLQIGHVDEFVQFLPADTPRGWRIAVADPDAGMKLLKDAKAAGHGATKMFSFKGTGYLPAPKETINQVLANDHTRADNALAARHIAANLEILKRETGITDAEVVRVPALFTSQNDVEGGDFAGAARLTRLGTSVDGPAAAQYGRQQDLTTAVEDTATVAYIPGAVNGVVLGKDRYLAPKQWGPVIDGKDIFTEAVDAAYGKAGMQVSYIDDYETYHYGRGEVHCGTNTLRDTSAPWWKR